MEAFQAAVFFKLLRLNRFYPYRLCIDNFYPWQAPKKVTKYLQHLRNNEMVSLVPGKSLILKANIGTSKVALEAYTCYSHLFSGFPFCCFPSQVVHVKRGDVPHSGPAKSAPARRLEHVGFNIPRVYDSNWHSMKSGIHVSLILIVWAFSWKDWKAVQIPLFCCLPCRDVSVEPGHCFCWSEHWKLDLFVHFGWFYLLVAHFFSYSIHDWSKPTLFDIFCW